MPRPNFFLLLCLTGCIAGIYLFNFQLLAQPLPVKPDSPTNRMLFVINGRMTSVQEIAEINPTSIEKMNIVKGDSAIARYGEKGKYGVAEITLKASLKDTIPAYFPGGINEWRRYLERSLQYPAIAQTKKTQGVVNVAITVNDQGKITTAKALNDPGDSLAAEAVRVVTNSPVWKPATVAGKPIPFDFKQKITFSLGLTSDGLLPVAPINNAYRFNQRVVIKTPRLYNGQPVDAVVPAYERPGVNVLATSGRSYFLNSAETMQMFGIVISNEGFVVPEDASVAYYDNNAQAINNWGGLKFVGGIPDYSLATLLGNARQKPNPAKIPIIWLNGKEATVEELKEQYLNRNLRGTYLVKMQDGPVMEKYGQQGKNGVLFATTKLGYPDNFLFLYEEKEISQDQVPKPTPGSNLSWRVLFGREAQKQYGDKAKYGAVIIQPVKSKSPIPPIIFTKVTDPASFPGGQEGWKKYLADSLRYPEAARKNKTEGTVQVEVILDSTGAVKRVMAFNHPGDGLLEEATRLLQEGPVWKPALQNGRAVAYRMILPIIFKLDPISYF